MNENQPQPEDFPEARLAVLEGILARDDAGHATLLPESRMRFEAERDLLREQITVAQYHDFTEAFRAGRRAAGLKRQDPRVVHHIDGDPYNNDPANLRVTDPKENQR